MAERKTYTAEDLKGMLGRKVLVEGVLEDEGSPSILPLVSFSHGIQGRAYVLPSAIVEILPEEIGIGDTAQWVKVQGPWPKAKVLAIHNGRAWVEYADGRRDDWPLSDLTLVERGQ